MDNIKKRAERSAGFHGFPGQIDPVVDLGGRVKKVYHNVQNAGVDDLDLPFV